MMMMMMMVYIPVCREGRRCYWLSTAAI